MGKYFLHPDAPFVLLLLAEEKIQGHITNYDGVMGMTDLCDLTLVSKKKDRSRSQLEHPINAKIRLRLSLSASEAVI